MRIIGLNFNKISAQKYREIDGEIKINSNLEFEDIKEDNIPIFGSDVLVFSFKNNLNYDPKIGSVDFEGKIVVLIEKEDKITKKEIIKAWEKKEINNGIRVSLLNFIMIKINIQALQLEEQLGLPYHLPMPRLDIKTKEEDF